MPGSVNVNVEIAFSRYSSSPKDQLYCSLLESPVDESMSKDESASKVYGTSTKASSDLKSMAVVSPFSVALTEKSAIGI